MARRGELVAIDRRARRATVRVETDNGVYVGRLYVAGAARRVSDVLCDDRQFLSLTDVSMNDGKHTESFMAVNKQFIRALRILDEGVPEPGAQTSIVPCR
jgi:hypothetical protein